MVTRILDIVVALFGCLLLLLMLPVMALLIKLDSRGPIFFKCDRVGRDGRLFKMYKFRTMYETPRPIGPSVSPLGDPRVTPLGRMLRRLKLNEFPQFFNLLKGDMTLIGPRPEAPDLAASYPPEARQIFSVKPGLIGPNQIIGRNEEELYSPGTDPRAYYLKEILPPKLALDLKYIEEKSFFLDCKYLLLGIWATISGAVSRRHLFDNLSQILQLAVDLALCLVSFAVAHFLRFEGFSQTRMTQAWLSLLPWAVLVRVPIFVYFGFYNTLIRHFSSYEVKNIFKGVSISSVFLVGFSFFFHLASGYSRAVFVIDWFCLAISLIGYRVLLHALYRRYAAKDSNGVKKRVLIWGAGDFGELCLRYLQRMQHASYEVMGFIDDDGKKRNHKLNGVRVLGDRYHLETLCQLYKIQEVFVSLHAVPPEELAQVMTLCQKIEVPVRLFSPPIEPSQESSKLSNPMKVS